MCQISRNDVIDTAVGALTAANMPTGPLDVTDACSLSLAEIASTFARVTGKPAAYEEETLEQAYASRAHHGASATTMAAWVSTYGAIAAGALSAVTDRVQLISWHPPMDFEAFLRKQPGLA